MSACKLFCTFVRRIYNIQQIMSLSKFESEVKYIAQPVEVIYERYADLRNLQGLKDMLSDPAIAERIAEKVPADKVEEARKQLENVEFEQDSISISSPVGQLVLRIVEREAPKCLKFASEGAPLQLYLWIQLLPHTDGGSRMKVTVGAEVNFFMKGMVSKPLQQAADMLANVLSVNA